MTTFEYFDFINLEDSTDSSTWTCTEVSEESRKSKYFDFLCSLLAQVYDLSWLDNAMFTHINISTKLASMKSRSIRNDHSLYLR